MSPYVFVLSILAFVFMVPLAAILTEHRRKLYEIKLRTEGTGGQQYEELKKELSELRATATEFDLSFDTALQRLEQRIERLEERLQRLERTMPAASQAAEDLEVRLG